MALTMASPLQIGGIRVKNRVAMTAMGVGLSARDGGVSDDIIAFYEARARGGVGLIISEITRVVDGAGAGEPCQLAARSLNDVPDLQRLVDAVHKYDTKLFIQLQHPGRQAPSAVTGVQAVAPSVLPQDVESPPRALTTEECEALAAAFVTGAQCAQLAGADGVELHGAHGYLINSFLSPAMNLRSDKYGGSFAGRMRFAEEILAGIRRVCGPRFPVSVRINAEESMPGGITMGEAKAIAAVLERAGADLINVSCMTRGCIEPGTYEQGWKRHMVRGIKEAVGIPVLGVCNIKEPEVGEQLLNDGVCDLIGVARGHLADPEWTAKALSGRSGEIRLCIGCIACFSEICRLHRIKCAVNPLTGREREYAHPAKDGADRPVAIIGGGPAGMEAALVLKERGFRPVIFEEGNRLGGALNVADKGYGKSLIRKSVDSLIAQVRREGIEARLATTATPENVRALEPCLVFVACGAVPFRPPIPGIDGANVCTAEEVLTGRKKPTGKVAVIGSGMTGLETAEMLAMDGRAVVIVEMLNSVGPGMYPSVVDDVMDRIAPHGARILTGCRLERIEPGRITLTRLPGGESLQVDADWVVLAMGVRPRNDVAEAFSASFAKVYVIGDASRSGRVLDATQDAHAKAFVATT